MIVAEANESARGHPGVVQRPGLIIQIVNQAPPREQAEGQTITIEPSPDACEDLGFGIGQASMPDKMQEDA